MPTPPANSGIRDNHSRGSVGEFLREQLKPGATDEQPQSDTAFELVTWLVLLEPGSSA